MALALGPEGHLYSGGLDGLIRVWRPVQALSSRRLPQRNHCALVPIPPGFLVLSPSVSRVFGALTPGVSLDLCAKCMQRMFNTALFVSSRLAAGMCG